MVLYERDIYNNLLSVQVVRNTSNIVEVVSELSTNVENATENDQIPTNFEVVTEIVTDIPTFTANLSLTQLDMVKTCLHLTSKSV